MIYRSKSKKQLPKIAKNPSPNKKFIEELLKEETFDCLKDRIRNFSAKPIVEVVRNYDPLEKATSRRGRKIRSMAIIKFLREKYTEDDLWCMRYKRERRKERSQLREEEYTMLGQLCHDVKKRRRKLSKYAFDPQPARKRRERKNRVRWKYEEYINSKQWERRRNLYWQSHHKSCAVCGNMLFVHLHHANYTNLGDEPDHHLFPLCSGHHDLYHRLNGTQRNMIRKTKEFIIWAKNSAYEVSRSGELL